MVAAGCLQCSPPCSRAGRLHPVRGLTDLSPVVRETVSDALGPWRTILLPPPRCAHARRRGGRRFVEGNRGVRWSRSARCSGLPPREGASSTW
jgi:hypothetical protein